MRGHAREKLFAKEQLDFLRASALVMMRVVAVVTAIGLVSAYLSDEGRTRLRLSDFAPFYSAAQIINSGQYNKIFDQQYHFALQQAAWPNTGIEGFYLYPPFFALFLAPLGYFSAVTAHAIWFAAHFLLIAGIAWNFHVMRKGFAHYYDALCFVFAFPPLLYGITAVGMNTLQIFLLSAFMRNLLDKNNYRAGIYLGLSAFRPPVPLMYLAVLFVTRNRSAVLGALLPIAVFMLLSFVFFAPDWPLRWMHAVAEVAPRELDYTAFQRLSLSSLGYGLAKLGVAGAHSTQLANLLLGVSIFLLACAVLRAYLLAKRAVGTEYMLELPILFTPLFLLISPHALLYDLGLLLFYFQLKREALSRFGYLLLGVGYLLCFPLFAYRMSFAITPLVGVLLCLGFYELVWSRAPRRDQLREEHGG